MSASVTVSPRAAACAFAAAQRSSGTRTERAGLSVRGWFGMVPSNRTSLHPVNTPSEENP
jgi:hypothetical protein